MANQNYSRRTGLNRKGKLRTFKVVLDIAAGDVLTSADSYQLAALPKNIYITHAAMFVLVANNAATTATADLGFAGGDTLVDGGNLKSVANTELTGGTNAVVPQVAATGGILTFTPTYVGAPTAGKVLVYVEYCELDAHSDESTNFVS